MMKKHSSWRLGNVAQRAAKNKYTFERPSADAIKKVVAGEHVRLLFELKNPSGQRYGAERMLVKVTDVDHNSHFTGVLDNDPEVIKDLKAGDRLTFGADHILTTAHDAEDQVDSLVEKYSLRCFVSAAVLKEGAGVSLLMRVEPIADEDSGWRLIHDDGDPDQALDPDKIMFVSLGAVLNHDDSFIALLDSPVGSVFMLNPETHAFEPSEEEGAPPGQYLH